MSGSASERSGSRWGKARRYQGNWMGMSMLRFQSRGKATGCRRGVCLWDGQCCAPLHSIYRSLCPGPSRLCLCSPHSDPANMLIFLEQWCQLLGPPLPWLFCLISSVSLSHCLQTLPVPSPWLGALLMPPSSHHRKYPCLDPCVCVCVRQRMCLFEEYLPEH